MTEKERIRYMRIDRQILETTFYLEKLIEDGYNVMLVSSRLHKIKDLIRNRDKNYFPLCGKTAEEKPREMTCLTILLVPNDLCQELANSNEEFQDWREIEMFGFS